MTNSSRCNVCRGQNTNQVLLTGELPVLCNVLYSTRAAAMAIPRARLALTFCTDCGHFFNADYDSSAISYKAGYENSLWGSRRFREYNEWLIKDLIDRYDLHGSSIVDIGCGRGQFLCALCEGGGNVGIGFDPSYSTSCEMRESESRVAILPEHFEKSVEALPADLICSRHALEHVPEPLDFLAQVRSRAFDIKTSLFFEVPNGLYTLRDHGIWDLIYEHCSYFTTDSLSRVFSEAGFEPVEVAETFGGQFLTIHAHIASTASDSEATSVSLQRLAQSFESAYQSKLTSWNARISALQHRKSRVVLWGAGSKATTFLNLLQPCMLDYVVDVNNLKHGRYVAGTGQMIVAPEFLVDYKPDFIICVNPNYIDEIATHSQSIGLHAEILPA